MADFETTTKLEDCRVWGWGLANIEFPDEVEIDHTIDEFMDRLSFQNSITYFHNLKFDGRFILDWLFKNGYDHLPEVNDFNIAPGHFCSIISDMGRFYSIKIKWLNGNTCELRDSFNKIPLSISRMAKAFKLEEGKGDIDYFAERPIGYRMTEEERDYIRRDVSIGAHAMRQVLAEGMTKLTVASDSLAQFKKLAGKDFGRLFPVLPEVTDSRIRRAYRGGFTYADPRFRGRRVGSGVVLDVNSLYPYIMKSALIPYGEPEYVEGKVPVSGNDVSIFNVTFTAKLKPGYIPCIQIKGSSMFTPTEYLTEITEPTTLMMTNVDFALYMEHYDMTILEWGDGYRFHAAIGIFDEYIDKWAKVKETTTGGQREIAKLFLNSLYGKFATNPLVMSKIPVLGDDGVVKLVRGKDNTREPIYTAAGVFITSHARDLTIRAAQANYDVFAYADTDSLHLMTDTVPESLDVHPTRMGAWKLEYAFTEAFYVRPKAYLERKHDGEFVNRFAGLPEAVSETLTFDDMVHGNVFHGKKIPKAVPGGIVLVDIPFELKLS